MNKGIFNNHILIGHLKKFEVANVEQKHEIIQRWAYSLSAGDLESKNEQSAIGFFIIDVFKGILGYQEFVGKDHWTIELERSTEEDATKPDASIGSFSIGGPLVLGVVEGKDAATDLDQKQKRANSESAVEQAFRYQRKHTHCKWVIVTNFREIRLYSKNSSIHFESFLIEEMATDLLLFEKFCFLFGEETLIRHNLVKNSSIVDEIYKVSAEEKLKEALEESRNSRPSADEIREKLKKKKPNKAVQKINAADNKLGEFIDIGYGVRVEEENLSLFPTTMDHADFFTGKILPYRAVGKVRYFDKGLLQGTYHSHESFFQGKRILLSRYGLELRKTIPISIACLVEDEFWNGRKFLTIKVTDDRLTPEFVTALLNSRLMQSWWTIQADELAISDSAQFIPSDIRKLPVVIPGRETLAATTENVQQLMQLEESYMKRQFRILSSLPDTAEFQTFKHTLMNNGYNRILSLRNFSESFRSSLPIGDIEVFDDVVKDLRRTLPKCAREINGIRAELENTFFYLYGLKNEEVSQLLHPGARP